MLIHPLISRSPRVGSEFVRSNITLLDPATGDAAGGETVRIYLTRVRESPAPVVTFGGSAATIVGGSYGVDGYIDVTTPAHAAGQVDVVVTDYYGASTLVDGFEYDGSPVTPWFEEDFSTYAGADDDEKTLDYLSNPNGWYVTGEDGDFQEPTGSSPHVRNGVIDSTDGYGTLTQALRCRHYDRTGNPSGLPAQCTDYAVGRNISLPSTVPEVWIEAGLKFTATSGLFTTVAPAGFSGSGCTQAPFSSHPSLKILFGRVDSGGRFGVFIGQGGDAYAISTPQAGDGNDFGNIGTLFDGNWHIMRFHFKLGIGNGIIAFSQDGVLKYSDETLNTGSTANIYGIAMQRNLNQGPGFDQDVWWGRIRAYDSDPSWSEF